MTSGNSNIILRTEDISKSFQETHAVKKMNFRARAGSVHAITGENGAGKSTLMKMFAGVHTPDTGKIFLRGKEVRFAKPQHSHMAGISTIFQEFTLVPNLTITENVFLGREKETHGDDGKPLSTTEKNKLVESLLDQVGLERNPKTMVSSLTVAEQQVLEIAKGFAVEAKVFIFDEPTAALSLKEVERLHGMIRKLKNEGRCILYISHRLKEVFELCDEVTVMKDGAHVDTRPVGDLSMDELVRLMVGRDLLELFPVVPPPAEDIMVRVSGLKIACSSEAMNFEVRRGEIIGLAGLEGQGQKEIMRSLGGVISPEAGEVMKKNRQGQEVPIDITGGVRKVMLQGLGFIPDDRRREGLFISEFASLSVRDNIALGSILHKKPFRYFGNPDSLAENIVKKLGIVVASIRQSVNRLSGGNQQKVLLGRWFCSEVDLLLFEEPTRGVDIGSKGDVYKLLAEFVENGGCVIFTSRELPEIIDLSHRILIVRDKHIVHEMAAEGATEESILSYAIGGNK
jgi:ribose transport system ATP-binding protein